MVALLALVIVAPTVFFYFLIIRGSDRYEPEPLWLLSLAFFWGAVVSTLTAIVGNEVGEGALRASLGAGQASLVDASTASFVAPLVEETMFRGVLYRHLRDATWRWPPLVSIALAAGLNSFIFAAIHPQGLMAVPLLTALALGFSMARQWRGSLMAPMMMHAMHNGMVTSLLVLML